MCQDQITLGSPYHQTHRVLTAPFKSTVRDSAVIGQEFPHIFFGDFGTGTPVQDYEQEKNNYDSNRLLRIEIKPGCPMLSLVFSHPIYKRSKIYAK